MPRCIPIAWYGTVEINERLKPLFEHPLVQRLRHLKQLSEKDNEFPSATQNRLTHSLRVLNDTKKIMALPEIGGRLHTSVKEAILPFALVHDTPHSALSHTLEPFFGDHNAGADKIVGQFKDAINAGGYDFEIFKALFLHQIPEHKIVSDKNFGTDKFDYLKFDALHCGIGNIIDTAAIKQHLAFRNIKMMTHVTAMGMVKELQRKYLFSYLFLYCPPEIMTWQRLTQKIAWYCMGSVGVLAPHTLRWMTDVEFWGKVAFTPAPQVQELYQTIKYARLPEVAIEFLPPNHINFLNKKPWHFVMEKCNFAPVEHWRKMDTLAELEHGIAELAGVKPWQVLLVSQDQPSRFVPTDCTLFNDAGEEFSLFNIDPEHLAAMKNSSRQSMFIRVAIVEKEPGEAEIVRKLAPEILRFLENGIAKIVEKTVAKPA